MKFFVALLFVLFIHGTISKSYQNYKVIQFDFKTEDELSNFLKEFPEETLDVFSGDGSLSYKTPNDIFLNPQQFKKLQNLKTFNYKILVDNYQQIIENERKSQFKYEEEFKNLKTQEEKLNEKFKFSNWFRAYHKYEEHIAYIKKFKTDYPDMVDIEEIGKTLEGRPLLVVKVHTPGKIDTKRNGMWWESVMHAREWATPAAGQYAVLQFLEGFKNGNTEIQQLLKKVNIYYCPFVNPDGFKYTERNRMWRKNRRGGYGVDINRNWIIGFGGSGSSGVRSSETYRGERALSENESTAINNFFTKNKNIKGAVDLHQYGQIILRPYGHTTSPSPDESRLAKIGADMQEAIRRVNGKAYRSMRAIQFWSAAGIASDTFYGTHKMLGYTIEMRPPHASFHIPESEILPNAQENFQALMVLVREVSKL